MLHALWDIFSSESTYLNASLFGGLLLFAASGEWVAERSGTINISVEAMLLSGAFMSAVGYDITGGSVIVGLLCGAAGGLIIALLQAQMSHRLVARRRSRMNMTAGGTSSASTSRP